jgi:hypothetical protein
MGLRSFVKRNRGKIIIALIILAVISTVFGARIWLFLNYVFGRDILIQVVPSATYVSLVSGEEREISFKTSISTNPFCEAECTSVFLDASSGRIVSEESFRLKGPSSLSKEYVVKPTKHGTGQDIYEFSVNCTGIKTALCETSAYAKERNVLIVVEYGLNDTEILLKEKASTGFSAIKTSFESLSQVVLSANATYAALKTKLRINRADERLEYITGRLIEHKKQVYGLVSTWDSSDYYLLDKQVAFVQSDIADTANESANIAAMLDESLTGYNSYVDNITSSREQLAGLNTDENAFAWALLNRTTANFNSDLAAFRKSRDLAEKKQAAENISREVAGLAKNARNIQRNATITREIENDLFSDILCNRTSLCRQHKAIGQRADETSYSLQAACNETETLRKLYYDAGGNSTGNATIAKYLLQDAALRYLDLLPQGINSNLIREALKEKDLGMARQDDNTTGIIAGLLGLLPGKCPGFEPVNISERMPARAEKMEANAIKLSAVLEEPSQRCCAFAKCEPCCMGDCSNKNYPVILLHGHALSKDISPEFSLSGFIQIQEKLQLDGFINAGTISSYIGSTLPPGTWGKEPLPVTIKATYYYDVYKDQENYLIVQGKSESIDTYAIRLKDIIDRVKAITGKDKVNIIAHSMGGLVARRYIQLFEKDDVDKLILVTVPNNGIQGTTARVCGIFGATTECNDMLAGSSTIKKLKIWNNGNSDVINIVGSGCRLDEEDGDGVLHLQDMMLEGSNNIIINGTCKQVETLHGTVLDPNIHPEVYQIILDALEK